MSEKEMRYLLGYVLEVSRKAVRVNVGEYEDGDGRVRKSGEIVWLPLSQIKYGGKLEYYEDVEFEVPEWLMKDKRLT